jgi:hypothetical protein
MKLMEKALIVLVIISIFILAGCAEEDLRTDQQKCTDYSTEYMALAQCNAAYPACRLSDNEYRRLKLVGMHTIMYCARSGGTPDKEVQPQLKDDTTA